MPNAELYPPTLWSLINALGTDGTHPDREELWHQLIAAYRPAISATVMRQAQRYLTGASPTQLTDDFFAYLFEKDLLQKADAGKGRFRCFIQGTARNFVRSQSASRDDSAALGLDPPDDRESERALEEEEERVWAQALLSDALDKLQSRHPETASIFCARFGLLDGQQPAENDEIAKRFGVTPNAVSIRIHRANTFVRSVLRRSVSEATAGRDEFELEWTTLKHGFAKVLGA